jgi:hypothetical protein
VGFPDDPVRIARVMWTLLEPIHAVTYFARESLAAYEEAGLRGFWRGYFAGRAAPLGPVGPAPVYAAFFGFARPMVARALPQVWKLADPASVLRARRQGARAALTRLLGQVDVTEAARLCREAAAAVEVAGRPLAAANADLPWPEDPFEVLWQAATVLREHRGDGHVAALLVAGLDGCESLMWRAALDSERRLLQPARGWSDQEWDQAAGRLAARGWLDAGGLPTAAGVAARDEVEARTDALAAGPWRALGGLAAARLAQLLRPLAADAAVGLPFPNPIGLPAPGTA